MTTGQSAPSFEALGVARAAGYTVFSLIDRVSTSLSFLSAMIMIVEQ